MANLSNLTDAELRALAGGVDTPTQEVPEKKPSSIIDVLKTMYRMDPTKGIPAINPAPALAGAAEQVAGGLSGLANSLSKGIASVRAGIGSDDGHRAADMRGASAEVNLPVYHPHTPVGQAMSLGPLLEKYQGYLVDQTAKGNIPDAVGATLAVAPDAVSTALGAKAGLSSAAPWAERFANSSMRDLVAGNGVKRPDLIRRVSDTLNSAQEHIPGENPTAGQILATDPAGSPIAALEKQVAQKPGGISADFGDRLTAQEQAVKAAKLERQNATDPMRTAALEAAGPVDVAPIKDAIDAVLKHPEHGVTDVIVSAMAKLRSKLNDISTDGKANAASLYAVRKQIGNIIEDSVGPSKKWDKKTSALIQSNLQDVIDNQIESAGGTGWKDYLNEFSTRSRAIDNAVGRAEAQPLQPTDVGNAANPTSLGASLPMMISKPVTMANWLQRRLEKSQAPAVNRSLADAMLGDPKVLAQRLNTANIPKLELALRSYMARMGQKGAAIGAATQTNQEQ